MATRNKKKNRRAEMSNGRPGPHGDIAGRGQDLAGMRKKRGRVPGDGKGEDIGISPGAFMSLEKHLQTLSPETKVKLLDHTRRCVDEALKPFVRLLERKSGAEHDLILLRDVGPNMLRTIIEFLEEEVI